MIIELVSLAISAATFGWVVSRSGTRVQGPKGADGRQGASGAQGPVGPQGPRGVQGPQGIQGLAGAQGPKGSDGVKELVMSPLVPNADLVISAKPPVAGIRFIVKCVICGHKVAKWQTTEAGPVCVNCRPIVAGAAAPCTT